MQIRRKMFSLLQASCQTFHRAQSMTCPGRLCICVDSAFGSDSDKAQQLYVAISRATRLDNIELYGELSPAMLVPSAESVEELKRQRACVVNLATDFPNKKGRAPMTHRLWVSNRKPHCMLDSVRAGTKRAILRSISYPLLGVPMRIRDVRAGDTVVLTSGRNSTSIDVTVSVLRVSLYDNATAAVDAETPAQIVGGPSERTHAVRLFKKLTHYQSGQVAALQVEVIADGDTEPAVAGGLEITDMDLVDDLQATHMHAHAGGIQQASLDRQAPQHAAIADGFLLPHAHDVQQEPTQLHPSAPAPTQARTQASPTQPPTPTSTLAVRPANDTPRLQSPTFHVNTPATQTQTQASSISHAVIGLACTVHKAR